MAEPLGVQRDLACFELPEIGRLHETGDQWEPYQLLDPEEAVVLPAQIYFADLQGASKPATTIRSYGMDLLRWFRFLWAEDVQWNEATRVEARDFSRWMTIANKPVRAHWRNKMKPVFAAAGPQPRTAIRGPNPITGKTGPGLKYAESTRSHSETTLRTFYDFHIEEGTGPILNPFPLDRSRRARRANAHHNPMELFRNERQGRYRPRVPKRQPRRIPDEMFNALFAALKHNRDRALLAAWVSTEPALRNCSAAARTTPIRGSS